MALKAKIIEVTNSRMVFNPTTSQNEAKDFSLEGKFFVKADYFDDGNPANILHTKDFEFPYTVTNSEAQTAIIAEAQRIRDARTRVAQLQAQVGQTLNIP